MLVSIPSVGTIFSIRWLSIIHQRFLCSHLSITYLTILLAFSLTFTTAELLLLQLRVVWQPRLHSVADTPQYFLYNTVVSSSLQHVQLSLTELLGTTRVYRRAKWGAVKGYHFCPSRSFQLLACSLNPNKTNQTVTKNNMTQNKKINPYRLVFYSS